MEWHGFASVVPLNEFVVEALWALVLCGYTAVRHTFGPRADVFTKSDVNPAML
jgi:hypothetical protein